jgi:alpha-amylase
MRQICFYFQVHQPYRLRRYRFFDIGAYHNYYDDYQNHQIMNKVAEKSYLPANKLMLELLKKYKGQFKISYSISGAALDQFESFAPEVLESFKELAKTGHVEFLAETDAHSLAALKSKKEFFRQVKLHTQKIEKHFGQKPSVFRNTELIYSDEIGAMVGEMGYEAMLTEGAKQILGWKSPNFIYQNAIDPKVKLLLKNYQLSDDIAFRFSNQGWEEWPLTTDKYVDWLNEVPAEEEVVNLFMDYETFGEHQWAETGIFDFMKALPEAVLNDGNFKFSTPSEVASSLQPISKLHVPHPISWADEERDLSAWLGNEMQDDAFDTLYKLEEKVNILDDEGIQKDWGALQNSDHFYYMCTKFFADGDVHKYFNPYADPYDAFMNYMNVVSDFADRVNKAYAKKSVELLTQKEAEDSIYEHEVRIKELKQQLEKAEEINAISDKPEVAKLPKKRKKAAPKKTTKSSSTKKTTAKKTTTSTKKKATKTKKS